MWDRALFALRTRSVDLGTGLASWRLSVVLMVLAALYYAFLAIWARSSPSHVVRNIATLVPYLALYLLLLVNTAACLWRRLGLLRRQTCAGPSLVDGTADWEQSTPASFGPEDASRALRRARFRVLRAADGSVWGVRRRWSGLGTYLFHGAFFLLAAGFGLTSLARHEAKVWVAEGERYTGGPGQQLSETPPRLLSGPLPSVDFELTRVEPAFWRDQLLFTSLEANLTLSGGRRVRTAINRPVLLGAATSVRLSGFGYAPRYELLDVQGRVIDSAVVKLNVFPPGQRDMFKIAGLPHRFHVEVLPDFEAVEGEATTRSLNLVRPAVGLDVTRGRVGLGRIVLTDNRSYGFEGQRIRFPEIRYWGELTIVSDPGAPLVFAGYGLGLLGLAVKLQGRRAEMRWRPSLEGGLWQGWGAAPPDAREGRP